MKYIRSKGPIYTSYIARDVELAVMLHLEPTAKVDDCLPMYPVALYVTKEGAIANIETIYTETDWIKESIHLSDPVETSGILLNERGEKYADMTVEGDADVVYDAASDVLEIRLGPGEGHLLSLGGGILAKVNSEHLLSMYFKDYKLHVSKE